MWKPFHQEMNITAGRKYHSNQRLSPPQKDINPALCKANNEAQQSSAPFLIRTHNLREAITMSYLQGHRYGILTI